LVKVSDVRSTSEVGLAVVEDQVHVGSGKCGDSVGVCKTCECGNCGSSEDLISDGSPCIGRCCPCCCVDLSGHSNTSQIIDHSSC